MNRWILAAAGMCGATVGLHVFGGGPEIHMPIQTSDLALGLRAISAVLWHAVTVILCVFTGSYLWAAFRFDWSVVPIVLLMAAVQAGFAGLFLYYGFALLGSVWPLPQWIIFLSIPAVSLMGLRGHVTWLRPLG